MHGFALGSGENRKKCAFLFAGNAFSSEEDGSVRKWRKEWSFIWFERHRQRFQFAPSIDRQAKVSQIDEPEWRWMAARNADVKGIICANLYWLPGWVNRKWTELTRQLFKCWINYKNVEKLRFWIFVSLMALQKTIFSWMQQLWYTWMKLFFSNFGCLIKKS